MKRNNSKSEKKAWLVDVAMGYGHQRTSYALKDLAFKGKIINANRYSGIPEKDKSVWETTRKFYELISDFKRIPLVGEFIFFIVDQFQKIFSFYPERDLSKPTFQLKQTFSLIKKGWGKDLIFRLSSEIKENPIPLISTFFTPAFMAEYHGYPGEIYCVVCDADVSRAWAPLNAAESKIKYLVPTQRVKQRLRLYGVKSENIFLTGYPLPEEVAEEGDFQELKKDLANRLFNLDPQRIYTQKYEALIETELGELPEKADHPLTIMFAVGGAGAQKEIGATILFSFSKKIKSGKLKIILVAGTKQKIKDYFSETIKKAFLGKHLGKEIEILFNEDMTGYFKDFNRALKKTDVLWTKPSELSFYAVLGIPIIIAPVIGSQEKFNRSWLLQSGFGILQRNPKYADQWVRDLILQGVLAEAAMEGFVEGEKMGRINIKKIISKCSG